MTTKRPQYHDVRGAIPKGICAGVVCTATALLAIPVQVNAVEFSVGDVEGRFDSLFSVGASWRMEDADPKYIAIANGGEGSTGTTDDGNQNFNKDATFTKIFKGVHDLSLKYDNYGLFTRGKYWYDMELKDEDVPHGHGANGYEPNTGLNDDNFHDFARFSGVELLDAFVYGEFELGDVVADLRVGRQVVSWGESTFIQGGINTINPIDVSAFRRPGAEIKEGLLPVNMLYGNFGLTDTLSLEAFYQLEWEKTVIDGCGTYFSTSDFAADGCNFVTVSVADPTAIAAGVYADREADIEPDDDGQYGFALRWLSEELDTEFGLYHINYHSRLPLVSATRSRRVGAPFIPGPDPTNLNPGYLIEYPEDIRLYGVSFSTNIGPTAVSGEISYRQNLPVQINGPEILVAALSESPISTFTPNIQSVGAGEVAHGYDRFEVYQAQVTLLQFFEQVLGAGRLTLIGEIGLTHVAGVPDQSEQRYGRNSGFGLGEIAALPGACAATPAINPNPDNCTSEGYMTTDSWGYRLRAALTYNDVFAGINMTPKLAWSHDVDGYGPGPGAQFEEGRMAASFGLDFDYLSAYNLGISYTTFSGGDYNVISDRDFASVTASWAL